MKYEQPECFHPEENNPYPLCVGKDASCAHCCCWADYDTPECEERAERLIHEKSQHDAIK